MAKFTWRELNQTLGTKTEAEVLDMLNEERSGRNRKVVLERLTKSELRRAVEVADNSNSATDRNK